MEKHKVSLLVINWEGFQKVKKFVNDNVTGIFINPPSIEELERRIRNRNTDSEDDIQKRLLAARLDIAHSKEYDFCVDNVEVPQAANDIFGIIKKVAAN